MLVGNNQRQGTQLLLKATNDLSWSVQYKQSLLVIASHAVLHVTCSITITFLLQGLGESRKSSTKPQLLKALEGLSVLEVACGSTYTIFKVRSSTSEDEEKLKTIPVYEPNSLK